MRKKVLKVSSIINTRQERVLLQKMEENKLTEKELFKYANKKTTLFILLRNGYFNIIPYITRKEYMFIELDNGKTIIEQFFEEVIKDKIKLNEIKKLLYMWDSIPLNKKREHEKRKGKGIEAKYFSLTDFLDKLIKKGIITESYLYDDLLDINSLYKTAYMKSEILRRCYNYFMEYYPNSREEITEFLLMDNGKKMSNLDLLVKSGLDHDILDLELKDNVDIARYYLKKKYFMRLLKHCSNEILLYDINGENKNILDYFLEWLRKNPKYIDNLQKFFCFDQNLLFYDSFMTTEIYLDRFIKLLIDNNKIDKLCDLMLRPDIYFYKSKYFGNKTIIKYLVEMNLLDTIIKKNKHNLDFWLYKENNYQTMLEYLLMLDSKKVVKSVVNNKYLMSEPNVVLTINKYLKDKRKIVPSTSGNEQDIREIVSYYSDSYYSNFSSGEINEEQYEKIALFEEMMLADGESDKEIVDLACKSFKLLYVNNFPYADREIANAILLKYLNPDFCLRYVPNKTNSFFDETEFKIVMNNKHEVSTFNHEFAHAVHYAYQNNSFECPEWFYKYLKHKPSRVIDEEKLKRILKRHKKSESNINQEYVKPYFEMLGIDELFYDYIDIMEYYLKMAQDSNNYSPETIEYLLLSIVDENDYFETLFNVICRRLKPVLLENEIAIEDIIDAIYNGKIYTNGITIDGKVHYISGHGEDYYDKEPDRVSKTETKFLEIFANYVSLLKTPNNEAKLRELKSLVGEDFIKELDDFYKDMDLKKIYYKTMGGGKKL